MKTCKTCCKNTHKELSLGASTASAKSASNNSERDNQFDNGRDLDTESILEVSDLSHSSLNLDSQGAHAESVVSVAESLQNRFNETMSNRLPPNWGDISLDDKLTTMFCMIADGTDATNEVGKKAEAINEKIDQMAQRLDDHANRIEDIEAENEITRTDIAALKERDVRGLLYPEVKVTGIPAQCKDSLLSITRDIFTTLSIQNELPDVYEVRLLNPKSSENSKTSTNATPKPSKTLDTIVFVIQFKSLCVRDKLLKVKRLRGALNFKDIYKDGPESKISIYEMLSPYTLNLLFAAKARAQTSGYKFVWARADNVFVRKNGRSEVIKIVTENDLGMMA